MKVCLRAACADGRIGEFLGATAVGDDHAFGPQPGGIIHVEGRGEFTVTRGSVREEEEPSPSAINGIPFGEAVVHEDGSISRKFELRRRDPEEARARLRAAAVPGDVIEEILKA